MNRSREEMLADIAARNAGRPTLTIWKDGSYVVHGDRDAEIATLCEPDLVLLNIDMETFEPVVFSDPQERIRLYEKMLTQKSVSEALDAAEKQIDVAEQVMIEERKVEYGAGFRQEQRIAIALSHRQQRTGVSIARAALRTLARENDGG